MLEPMNISAEARQQPCPCGSGRSLADCCLPLLSGSSHARTAESLMRSRYSAYVLGNAEYLAASWHVSTRPPQLDAGTNVEWLGLQVLSCRAGMENDTRGSVEFIARYRLQGIEAQAQENSRFVREAGQWFYLNGDMKTTAATGRNDPCGCGSGKKFKKCCGR
ncbi:MAG TPA: YchJ family metal-binding protein [Gammaproteobacteria bacterium]|nr:YchJ family metal-binding protein [Gammaproteobacteria bacterium]